MHCMRGSLFDHGVKVRVNKRSFRTHWACVFVPHQVVDDHRDDLTNIANDGKVRGRYLGAHLHHKKCVSMKPHIMNPNLNRDAS